MPHERSGHRVWPQILGSGRLVASLDRHGLIERCAILIDPTTIGDGTPLSDGAARHPDFRLVDHRVFRSGALLMTLASR
jgi:dihydrofolate reductase